LSKRTLTMRLRLPRLAPYRLRLLLRAAFLFLMAATVGLALSVLLQKTAQLQKLSKRFS